MLSNKILPIFSVDQVIEINLAVKLYHSNYSFLISEKKNGYIYLVDIFMDNFRIYFSNKYQQISSICEVEKNTFFFGSLQENSFLLKLSQPEKNEVIVYLFFKNLN